MKTAFFLIRSPFEMLCAVCALKEYDIDSYDLCIVKWDDGVRYRQIEEIAHFYGIEYKLLEFSDIAKEGTFTKIKQVAIPRKKHYNYVFCGDFRGQDVALFALSFAGWNSKFVYLDDGNISIVLFKGAYKHNRHHKLYGYVFSLYSLVKNVKTSYYTVFDGLTNEKYDIRNCNLSHLLLKPSEMGVSSKIYIIGTNVRSYCVLLGIEFENYICSFKKLIESIRNLYPHTEIVFIPHGRDSMSINKDLSEEYGLSYMPLDTCIEAYFVKNNIRPSIVYGWGSTALFSLKTLFPACDVYNVNLSGENSMANYHNSLVSDYYSTKHIVNLCK